MQSLHQANFPCLMLCFLELKEASVHLLAVLQRHIAFLTGQSQFKGAFLWLSQPCTWLKLQEAEEQHGTMYSTLTAKKIANLDSLIF